MVSLKASLFNALLRSTIKKSWKPDMDVAAMRRSMSMAVVLFRQSVEFSTLAGPGGTIDRVAVGDPEDKPLTLLYLHGGAFCWHSPALYRSFVTRICEQIGASGYIVDYRLAPEHKFPAGVNDCLETYRWLLEQPGIDPSRLVLAGDSAGGSLVMTTLMQARDQGLAMPACAALFSPLTDATGSGSSVEENKMYDAIFTHDALEMVLKWYLSESCNPADPLISPLFGDLQGLPPMLFQVGSTEMLRDDSTRMVDNLIKAGGVAELQIWSDLPHVFQVNHWLMESDQALRQLAAFVSKYTAVSPEKSEPGSCKTTSDLETN